MSDIVLELVKERLRKVKKSGPDNAMAICPFHKKVDGRDEENGSFAINIRNGLWYCFACHERGNLRQFLRLLGVSRLVIENRYGELLKEVEKPSRRSPQDPLRPIEASEEPLDESFLGLFDYCPLQLLEGDESEPGFPEELLQRMDIGFDEKHQRITFPLRDWRGQLVGVSGRATRADQKPRYKVYDWEYKDWGLPPRTLEKRVILWNAHNVFTQLAFETDPNMRYVVVVEGFKALLRLLQAGIHNTVALLGSMMSEEQMWLLQRMGCPVLLMLDNNPAGWKGALEMGKKLMKSLQVLTVEYEAEQPSRLAPEEVHQSIINAQRFDIWYVKHLQAASPRL